MAAWGNNGDPNCCNNQLATALGKPSNTCPSYSTN